MISPFVEKGLVVFIRGVICHPLVIPITTQGKDLETKNIETAACYYILCGNKREKLKPFVEHTIWHFIINKKVTVGKTKGWNFRAHCTEIEIRLSISYKHHPPDCTIINSHCILCLRHNIKTAL